MPEYVAKTKDRVVCYVIAPDDDQARRMVTTKLRAKSALDDFMDWFFSGMWVSELKTPPDPEIRQGFQGDSD